MKIKGYKFFNNNNDNKINKYIIKLLILNIILVIMNFIITISDISEAKINEITYEIDKKIITMESNNSNLEKKIHDLKLTNSSGSISYNYRLTRHSIENNDDYMALDFNLENMEMYSNCLKVIKKKFPTLKGIKCYKVDLLIYSSYIYPIYITEMSKIICRNIVKINSLEEHKRNIANYETNYKMENCYSHFVGLMFIKDNEFNVFNLSEAYILITDYFIDKIEFYDPVKEKYIKIKIRNLINHPRISFGFPWTAG